jgi:hypothetical protein
VNATLGDALEGRWICAALLAACCVCTSATARAQASSAFELDYAADASCPDAADFTRRVQERIGEPNEVEGATHPQVVVRLRAAQAGFVAQLELQRSPGHVEKREVNGATCSEVASATAFVLALALKDEAADVPPADAPGAVTPPPLAAAASALTPGAPRETVALAAPSPGASRHRAERIWSFGGGAQVGARTGLGPIWTHVGAAFLDMRRVRPTPLVWWLRAAFVAAQPVLRQDRAGKTRFAWWAGRLELCPVSPRLFGPVTLSPCIGSHVGVLSAQGTPSSAGAVGSNAHQLWWDMAATLRLALQPEPWLSLEAQGDLLVPLTRDQFSFQNPSTPVYSVPTLARAGWLGLSARFP